MKHWGEVQDLIKAKKWNDILSNDQLRSALSRGLMMYGFVDCDPSFPPTFKVLRARQLSKGTAGDEVVYKDQRISSYTDRILYKTSVKGVDDEAGLKCNHFTNVPVCNTSDHKPVRAGFSLRVPKPSSKLGLDLRRWVSRGTALHKGQLPPVVVFEELSCTGLEPFSTRMDVVDPLISFWVLPVRRSSPRASGRTKVVWNDENPVWKNKQIPAIDVPAPSYLMPYIRIILQVYDKDYLSRDTDMGHATLPIGDLFNAPDRTLQMELPLIKSGVKTKGMIKFKAHMLMPTDGIVYDNCNRVGQLGKCQCNIM